MQINAHMPQSTYSWPPLDEQWSEDDIQMYVVMESHRSGFVFHGDQNKAMRSKMDGAKRKLLGMRAGWPDLCYWVPRLVYIELKTKNGAQSPEQIVLENVCPVEYHLVKAKTGPDAWSQIQEILYGETG